MNKNQRNLVARTFSAILFLCVGAGHGCSGGKTEFPDRPLDIEVLITKVEPPLPVNDRIPIALSDSSANTLTVALRMRNSDGSTRTQFTGEHAWVRLSMNPGNIISVRGMQGENDPNVINSNVRLTNGKIEGLQLHIQGSYGDVRLIAEHVGYSPVPASKQAACKDGIDNNGDGFADFPNDPNCLFENDDSESSFDAVFGSSDLLPFAFPTLEDVQGRGAQSPFIAKQIEILGNDRPIVVTAITNDGMYVTDYKDFDAKKGTYNSIFIFNFSTPFDVQICDRLTRLRGNISEFFGFTELGTPSWSKVPWINEVTSGPCPLSNFYEMTESIAGNDRNLEAYEASLVRIENPTIGEYFGPNRPDDGKFTIGASNCDLDGDGTVGFDAKKATFRENEKKCSDNCSKNQDCTEWNNYQARGQVKIYFGQTNKAQLFLQPGAVPTFNPEKLIGRNKIAELRGILRDFKGPTPSFTLVLRCEDDVIFVGQDPQTNKDAKHACIRRRIEPDPEGSN